MNISELGQQIAIVATKVDDLRADMNKLEKSMSRIEAQANRWKGAFLAIMALGGLIGWLGERATALWSSS